jgi:hypothetical protein
MKILLEYNSLPLEMASRADRSAAAKLQSLRAFVEFVKNLPLRCDGVDVETVNLAQEADKIQKGEESRWEPRVYFDEKLIFDRLPESAEILEMLAERGAHTKTYKPSKKPKLRILVYYNSFPPRIGGCLGPVHKEFSFSPKIALEKWLGAFYEAASDFDEASLELVDIAIMREREIPEFAREINNLIVVVFNGKPVFSPKIDSRIPGKRELQKEIERWLNEGIKEIPF